MSFAHFYMISILASWSWPIWIILKFVQIAILMQYLVNMFYMLYHIRNHSENITGRWRFFQFCRKILGTPKNWHNPGAPLKNWQNLGTPLHIICLTPIWGAPSEGWQNMGAPLWRMAKSGFPLKSLHTQ